MRVLTDIDREEIDRLHTAGEFFWLDLIDPPVERVHELAEIFGLHPIAIEDMVHFGQRPKLDDYPEFLHLVFYGVEANAPVEIHIVVHGDAMVTIRRGDCESLVDARDRVADIPPEHEEYAVYRVLDALTDSYFPYLEQIDDEIDDLEVQVVGEAGKDSLQKIVALKRRLGELRRLVGPQRDILAIGDALFHRLPGFTGDGSHDYFRDVYDHLLRISDSLETYRDVLTGLLDVYLSAQSNRLNQFITKLTVVGTIFLPLTFLTGFFGQNFGWLVDNVGGELEFLLFGIGLELMSVVILLWWMRRRETGQ